MNWIDYVIVVVYLIGVLGIGYFFKENKDSGDYFLGGRSMGWIPLSLSTMATQLSAISFISAPAFVGIASTGLILFVKTVRSFATIVSHPGYGSLSYESALQSGRNANNAAAPRS